MRIESVLRLFVLVFVALLSLAAAGCAQTGVRPEGLHHADMVLVNGKVVTVDKGFSIQEAVAIRDGKILAVGPTSDIRALAGAETKVIDLQGRTVIPGLMDSHIHFLRAGFTWRREVRLDQAHSVQEILSLIEKRASQVSPGDWILTYGGWHYSQLQEGRAPTRQELDRVAPKNPVVLRSLLPHPSTHFAVLNGAALEAAGITRDTAAPPNSVIEKDAAGEPTGVLRRAAVALALGKVPRASFQEKVEGLKLVMRDFHAAGLTSVIETVGGGVVDDDYKVLFELWRRNELTMRTALLINTAKFEDGQRWIKHLPMGFGDDWLKVNGFGEQLVNAVQDNLAPAFPLKPEGLEEYRKFLTEAAKNRWSFQQHTTLGTTAKAYLDIIEEVDRQYPVRNLRWSLAHVETISATDMQRAKRLGMGLTIQDRQVIQSELMKQAWGSDAVASAPPMRKMLELGLPLGAGTDATVVTPYHPFTTLWWMVTGKDWAGRVVRPNERLSRQDALRVHTTGSAWFSFDEKIKGSIEPGKLADLVVLTDDYLTVPEEKIRAISAVMTIVGGKVVYEKQ
ncbi:MAG: amidohydrolase family protein [Candidatus Rokubacteria bacterium]|nr:amidohydrolase family protein [Candidatus Rokubacteria bacterium]